MSACSDEQSNCQDVAQTIANYVINFFGCSDCVENFKKEIEDFPIPEGVDDEDLPQIDSTNDKDDNDEADLDPEANKISQEQVLWLWELHNSVNKRLASDPNQDPKFPKVQFPTIGLVGEFLGLTLDQFSRFFEPKIQHFIRV